MRWIRIQTGLALGLFVAAAMGCESVSLIGRQTLPPGAGQQEAEVTGVVDKIDLQQRLIFIRTATGNARTIRYSPDVRVLSAGREVPIRGLRPGDRVAMQLLDDGSGRTTADFIRLQPAALGAEAAVLEGRVERIAPDGGYFELQPRAGEVTRVYLPRRPGGDVESRFRRIRVGDFVRLEGSYTGARRFEMDGFL